LSDDWLGHGFQKRQKQSVSEIEGLKDICQRAGLKATHQRLEILREMMKANDHPSAEEIHQRVRTRMPTISLDTVYRTLSTFEKSGVIARLHVLDGRIRYDPMRERHDHFVCTECKSVLDCQIPGTDDLRIPSDARKWGEVASVQVELRGVCRNCLNRRRRPRRSRD
jgi:Fur family peroxide stress response transcriptional regulator